MTSEKGKHSGREAAEGLAVEALTWLANEPDALGRFMALSGIGPADLRNAANDPGFLGGVLDFFVTDERLLVAFAGNAGVKPERVVAAWRDLGGTME